MRRFGSLLVLALLVVPTPARASHGEGCSGSGPADPICSAEFTAAASVTGLQIDGAFKGAILVRLTNQDTGYVVNYVCAGPACAYSGSRAGKFPQGASLVIEAYAVGVGPFLARVVYSN